MQHVTFVMTWSYMRNGRGCCKDMAAVNGPAIVQSKKNNHKNSNFIEKPDEKTGFVRSSGRNAVFWSRWWRYTYQRRNRLWHNTGALCREVIVRLFTIVFFFKSLTLLISLASLHQPGHLSISSVILTVIPVVSPLPGDSRGKQLQLPSFLFWLRSDGHNATFISLVNIELWRPNATVKARFVDKPVFMWMVYSHHTAQSALTSEWWGQQKQSCLLPVDLNTDWTTWIFLPLVSGDGSKMQWFHSQLQNSGATPL